MLALYLIIDLSILYFPMLIVFLLWKREISIKWMKH